MATVRELVARFGVKTDPKGFNQAQAGLKKLASAARFVAGAFIGIKAVGFAKALIAETAAVGDSIDKVSSKLGIATGALQELRFAADQSGVAQSALDMGMQRFIRRASEASQGTGVALKAFEEMGIQLKDASGNMLPAEDLLGQVSDALSRTSTDADRVRLAFKLFDSEGVNMVNMLRGGRSNLEALRAKARQTGGVMSDELIKASVEYTDTLSEMRLTMRGLRNILGAALLPIMTSVMKRIMEFAKANRAAIKTFAQWAKSRSVSVIKTLGVFFSRAAKVLGSVATFTARIARGFDEWAESLDPVSAQFLKLAKLALLLAIALMLPGAPILLLAGLVALLIDDFETWRKGGESVIGDLVGSFEKLGNTITEQRDKFLEWVDENKTGITLVLSMVSALALVIYAKLIAAQGVAAAGALRFKALWLVSYAKVAAASAAAAIKSAAAWLVATAPMVITAALLAVIVGTLIFLGAELVKLALGQENFFSTMSDGIADLITKYDGVAPAIGAMLTTALGYWLTFFGKTEDEADEWVDNLTTTLQDLWVNVLEFWGGKLREFFSGIADLIGIDIGAAGQVTRPATIQRQASAGAGGSVVNRNQSSVSVSVTAGPGMNEERLAELIPIKIREEQDRQYRAAQRNLVVEGAT